MVVEFAVLCFELDWTVSILFYSILFYPEGSGACLLGVKLGRGLMRSGKYDLGGGHVEGKLFSHSVA